MYGFFTTEPADDQFYLGRGRPSYSSYEDAFTDVTTNDPPEDPAEPEVVELPDPAEEPVIILASADEVKED